MARSRRHVLRFGLLSAVATLTGCLSGTPTADTTGTSPTPVSPTPTSTPTETSEPTATSTPTPSDPIEVVCHNETDTTVQLQVELSGFGGFLTEESISVPADETASLDSGITETGRYLLTARSDSGHEESWEVDIGEYSLRTGANFIVLVGADGFELLVEE